MKITLIITTYNWPEALEKVIESALIQSKKPFEIIVADDGSDQNTQHVVQRMQSISNTPIIHSFQKDKGFRAARSRNKAIQKATGDYIVFIDGDMVLHKHFIRDHGRWAQPKQVVQGSRVTWGETLSMSFLQQHVIPNFFSRGIGNRKNMLVSPFLAKIFTKELLSTTRARSCNMALWRTDAILVNGFDNRFESWGYEDTEFTQRLLNVGLSRIYVKFAAIAFHLYHPEKSKQAIEFNRQMFCATKTLKLTRCEDGLAQCES